MARWTRNTVGLLLVLLMSGGRMSAGRKTAAAKFDYFLLALAWAPDFCASPSGVKDVQECGAGRKVGFVVHGLWPEENTGRGPESCGASSPVAQSIVQLMLAYIPSPSLIQHEWASHGSCTGMSPADFFAAIRRTRDSVVIPTAFRAPSAAETYSPAKIEEQFAEANPTFPRSAFRAVCAGGGSFSGVRVCFSKGFSPQACTSAAGGCSTRTLTLLPVR
jgi:ribonuclease T2